MQGGHGHKGRMQESRAKVRVRGRLLGGANEGCHVGGALENHRYDLIEQIRNYF